MTLIAGASRLETTFTLPHAPSCMASPIPLEGPVKQSLAAVFFAPARKVLLHLDRETPCLRTYYHRDQDAYCIPCELTEAEWAMIQRRKEK